MKTVLFLTQTPIDIKSTQFRNVVHYMIVDPKVRVVVATVKELEQYGMQTYKADTILSMGLSIPALFKLNVEHIELPGLSAQARNPEMFMELLRRAKQRLYTEAA